MGRTREIQLITASGPIRRKARFRSVRRQKPVRFFQHQRPGDPDKNGGDPLPAPPPTASGQGAGTPPPAPSQSDLPLNPSACASSSCFRVIALPMASLLPRFCFCDSSQWPLQWRRCLLPSLETGWGSRRVSYGAVNLVISDGKPKFEAQEVDPTRKERYRTKKRLKLQRKREKRKRKEANRRDPRCIRVKGKKKKPRFPDAEARLKYKIEKAKMKEALLVEKLKNYEVPKVQGPTIKPEEVTGEERFYLKKMAQKSSNYVPLGRRGVFGGVVLNMHLHWKKHETVKVICKPCKPGQVHEYARELARLSGGTPIQTIGNDTIVFYRGKNYTQPEVMSPVDTLSKKRALEKSKYEQSLETVRHFIAVSEKELELYYQHIALYGDPRCRASDSSLVDQSNECEAGILEAKDKGVSHQIDAVSTDISELETDTDDEQLLHAQTDYDTEQCSNTNIDLEGDTGGQIIIS
ncbi:hypothetical protein Taro_007220 [Colocasia esculenta]|uniref:CRM domain-containing protein n=1 Tax=Colocasia esculenta TaxID=4460 RepID=A0A843U368_COLES|nr:hypothetical protein [Colocasia esculenta]